MKKFTIIAMLIIGDAFGTEFQNISWHVYISQKGKSVETPTLNDDYKSLLRVGDWSCYVHPARTEKDSNGKIKQFDRDFVCQNIKTKNSILSNIVCSNTDQECKGHLSINNGKDAFTLLYVGTPY